MNEKRRTKQNNKNMPVALVAQVPLVQVSLASMARQPRDIDPSSCFRARPVPETGLKEDLSYPLRVYVLRCKGGKYYIGIHPKDKIRQRIEEQFAAKQKAGSSQFCEANPPKAVVCVWPAIDHAVEAAMFFAMVEALDCTDFGTLGGWVFTSAKPSPLAVMVLEQCRRQVANRCFECNGEHYAGHPTCRGPNQDCWYKCVHCTRYNNVSCRGQSRLCGPGGPSGGTGAPSSTTVAKSSPPELPLATARATSATPVPVATPKAVAVAKAPPTRKRAAAVAFQRTSPALPFEATWDHTDVRKSGRYHCVKDFLRQMDTVSAGKALPTIGQRIRGWADRQGWPNGSYDSFPEFTGGFGGGQHGIGCTKKTADWIYKKFA